MKEKLTNLEANLFRFAFLEGKFYNLYQEFPKIPEGKTFFDFKSTVREYAVIQLHNFIKVRKLFILDLKLINKEKIDESLKPFYEPIEKQKEGIRLLRNKYHAHIQDDEDVPFARTAEEIIHNTGISLSWNDVTFYCGCAFNYAKFIKLNFQGEFKTAREKYYKNVPIMAFLQRYDIKHVHDVDWEIIDTVEKAIVNLKTNNLVYEFSKPEESWSLSYTENNSNINIKFDNKPGN